MSAAPLGDALDDEEPSPRLDVAEPARLGEEDAVGRLRGEPALELLPLAFERSHLGDLRGHLPTRLEVGDKRVVVQVADDAENGDDEPAARERGPRRALPFAAGGAAARLAGGRPR